MDLRGERFDKRDPLAVHKMYIHALQRKQLDYESPIHKWLRICCQHDASIMHCF